MATYKDLTQGNAYFTQLVERLNSGEAKVVTSKSLSGRVVYDGETGSNIFVPFLTQDEGGAAPRVLTAAEVAQAKYNPNTEQNELTLNEKVSPYIDLGNKPIAAQSTWPVQDLGNGQYQLSSMNGSESGYANVIIKPDATGKATVTENNPASFSSYDSGNFVSDFTGAAKDLATSEAGLMLAGGLAAGGAFGTLGAATGTETAAGTTTAGTSGGMLSGYDAAMADLAASSPAISAPTAAGAGLLGGAAGGVNLGTATAGDLAMAYDPVAANIAAGMSPETAAAAALGTGYGAAAVGGTTLGALGTGVAAGTATGAAGALTASELAKAGLIQGGLGLAGGLLQGDTTKSALEADAAARAALAQKTMDMGKFTPVGTTTRFGTSSFTTDPVTGTITPSYSLSPEALAYQNSLSALGTQGLAGGQTMMNLGQQYVGESPEAVRQRYMDIQNALLAPGNEQALAGIRSNLVNTGRQGLAYGATEAGGMGATNPELAAYYNSLANQQRQLAAGAETQYQNQVNFGTGLMGSATTPFTNVFTAQKGVEAAGQQPLELSTNFANTVATRGAAQGANYATAMSPSLQSSYNAANYNPYATAFQGAASNPLVGQGLLKAWS